MCWRFPSSSAVAAGGEGGVGWGALVGVAGPALVRLLLSRVKDRASAALPWLLRPEVHSLHGKHDKPRRPPSGPPSFISLPHSLLHVCACRVGWSDDGPDQMPFGVRPTHCARCTCSVHACLPASVSVHPGGWQARHLIPRSQHHTHHGCPLAPMHACSRVASMEQWSSLQRSPG